MWILCWFALFLMFADCFFLNYDNEADIFPKDVLVFVGETLTVTCVLKKNYSIEDVYINVVSGKENDPIPKEYHYIKNNMTVSGNVTIKEDYITQLTVECLLKSTDDKVDKQLRSMLIYVENPIRNVTNFTAYYLYKDRVNMTWSLDQNYRGQSKIAVDVGWHYDPSAKRSKYLKCSTSTLESCIIMCSNTSASCILGNEISEASINYVYVRITVMLSNLRQLEKRLNLSDEITNRLDVNATADFKVYIYNATKSGPPDNLFVDTNSTCVSVTWKDPEYLLNCGQGSNSLFGYRLTYVPVVGQSVNNMTLEAKYRTSNLPVFICKLSPFTNYSVSVQVRREDKQPWSDWSKVVMQTKEDTPLFGPPTLSSSFHSTECSTQSAERRKRVVTLYWLNPDTESLQGLLDHYEICVNSSLETIPCHELKKTNSHKVELDCDQKYDVFIYTSTKIGKAQVPSVISIPPQDYGLTNSLDVKVEQIQSQYEFQTFDVIWKPFTKMNATLVFYICKENKDIDCSNGYVNLSTEAKSGHYTIYNISNHDSLFGYALVLGNGETQGISLTKCVFRRNTVPRKPEGLMVFSGDAYGSLKITWLPEPCNKEKFSLIENYTIYICSDKTFTRLTQCQEHNVISSSNNLTVQSLDDDKEYNVSIRATSPFAVPGELSDFRVGKTKYRLSGTTIAAIVSPLVILFAISGVFVYFCWACIKSRRQINKIKIQPEEDKTSSHSFRQTKIDSTQDHSDESGIESICSSNEHKEVTTSQPQITSETEQTKSYFNEFQISQLPPLGYTRMGHVEPTSANTSDDPNHTLVTDWNNEYQLHFIAVSPTKPDLIVSNCFDFPTPKPDDSKPKRDSVSSTNNTAQDNALSRSTDIAHDKTFLETEKHRSVPVTGNCKCPIEEYVTMADCPKQDQVDDKFDSNTELLGVISEIKEYDKGQDNYKYNECYQRFCGVTSPNVYVKNNEQKENNFEFSKDLLVDDQNGSDDSKLPYEDGTKVCQVVGLGSDHNVENSCNEEDNSFHNDNDNFDNYADNSSQNTINDYPDCIRNYEKQGSSRNLFSHEDYQMNIPEDKYTPEMNIEEVNYTPQMNIQEDNYTPQMNIQEDNYTPQMNIQEDNYTPQMNIHENNYTTQMGDQLARICDTSPDTVQNKSTFVTMTQCKKHRQMKPEILEDNDHCDIYKRDNNVSNYVKHTWDKNGNMSFV
ncbi:leukemia inhibitory factor receptor isoform X2 [Biomphalaria glabrata]|nr:leukemia inhibitory factor receptor isoform X2 [Biomphalaria glabrata]